jgi:putative PIN family toxin of toxin-antitoxin system
VFLDTNVLVSAFATRGVCADVLRVVLTEHELVTSGLVLRELSRVLRKHIKLPVRIVDEIETFLREHEVAAKPVAPWSLPLRDEADRWVLASAIDAKVDVMVTGGRDLLDIAGEAPIEIVDPRGFWQLIRRF